MIHARVCYTHYWPQGHHWMWQSAFHSERQMAILLVPYKLWRAAQNRLWSVFCFSQTFFCKLNSCTLANISWLWIKRFAVRFKVFIQEDRKYFTETLCDSFQCEWNLFIFICSIYFDRAIHFVFLIVYARAACMLYFLSWVLLLLFKGNWAVAYTLNRRRCRLSEAMTRPAHKT